MCYNELHQMLRTMGLSPTCGMTALVEWPTKVKEPSVYSCRGHQSFEFVLGWSSFLLSDGFQIVRHQDSGSEYMNSF